MSRQQPDDRGPLSGFRIVDIAPHDFEVLKSWVHKQQQG